MLSKSVGSSCPAERVWLSLEWMWFGSDTTHRGRTSEALVWREVVCMRVSHFLRLLGIIFLVLVLEVWLLLPYPLGGSKEMSPLDSCVCSLKTFWTLLVGCGRNVSNVPRESCRFDK